MMCRCPQTDLIDTGFGLSICRLCGTAQRRSTENIVSYCVKCPNRPPYSRARRFEKLLCNVFGHRVSRISQSLGKYLLETDISSVQDLTRQLKRSQNRKHKRYDAIAFLARQLLGLQIVPLTLQTQQWCKYKFREVQILHQQTGGTFPAYSWIIEKCLCSLNRTDLCQFLHKLKCQHRRKHYESMYGAIFKYEV